MKTPSLQWKYFPIPFIKQDASLPSVDKVLELDSLQKRPSCLAVYFSFKNSDRRAAFLQDVRRFDIIMW